jgi:hypothetical protein
MYCRCGEMKGQLLVFCWLCCSAARRPSDTLKQQARLPGPGLFTFD